MEWDKDPLKNVSKEELGEMIAAQVVSFKFWGRAFMNTGDFSPSYRGYHQPFIYFTNTFQCWVYRSELSRPSVALLALP